MMQATGDAVATNAPILLEALHYSLWTVPVVAAAYLFLPLTSGRVVRATLAYAGVEITPAGQIDATGTGETAPDGERAADGAGSVDGDGAVEADGTTVDAANAATTADAEGATNADAEASEDTGRAIGKIENVLVLTLMVLQAYTALGVIFAAKSLVRKDDMDGGNTSYYLTGTLANYTYSIAVGVGLHVVLWVLVTYDLL